MLVTRDIKYLASTAETLLEIPNRMAAPLDKDIMKLIDTAAKLCLAKIIRELK
jgi:hypothetical protein